MADMETARRDGVRLAPETRTAAARYLERTGNADILPILGLAGEPEPASRPAKGMALAGRVAGTCPVCGNRLASHGGCNRRKACREATHGTGGAR
jgi:hypothetical protein